MSNWTIDSKRTTTIRATMTPYAVPGNSPILEGRGARLREIAMFNNVCDIVCGRAINAEGGGVDGYFFRSTNAVARGVARVTGLNVYWLGADRFVACNDVAVTNAARDARVAALGLSR